MTDKFRHNIQSCLVICRWCHLVAKVTLPMISLNLASLNSYYSAPTLYLYLLRSQFFLNQKMVYIVFILVFQRLPQNQSLLARNSYCIYILILNKTLDYLIGWYSRNGYTIVHMCMIIYIYTMLTSKISMVSSLHLNMWSFHNTSKANDFVVSTLFCFLLTVLSIDSLFFF